MTDLMPADPWRAAARSLLRHGDAPLDTDEHLVQRPVCAVAGQHDTVYTRCCGKPVPLGRPTWPCEIPIGTGGSVDYCDRPFVMYGEPA